MLLEKGHKNVYVSRQFAIKNGMVDAKVSTPVSYVELDLIDSTAWDPRDILASRS
jgi:hypothetical protein